MGTCNTTANEKGGKDLLLKVCSEIDVDVLIGTADDPQALLATAHGLRVGDLVRFGVEALGTVNDVTAGLFYFVTSVPSANSFKISSTPGGTAITFDPSVTDLTIEVFKTVGGLRSKGFSFASDAIDRSNHGSNQWREILDDAGVRSVSISGSGVYTNHAEFKRIRNNAFANRLTCLAFIDVSAGEIYNGCFKLTAVEGSGDYDGESSYSLSAESSGQVVVSEPGVPDVVGISV